MYIFLSLKGVTKLRGCYMYVYLLQYIFKPWAVYVSVYVSLDTGCVGRVG